MRKYTLASLDARNAVDLRNYEETIMEAVHSIMPKAIVRVEKDCYYVSPTPEKGNAIKIGRLICKSTLGKHCIHIPKLFSSTEADDREEKSHDRKQQQTGGHF